MRFAAFFKIYKMCTLLHRSKLNIFEKMCFEMSAIFVKLQVQCHVVGFSTRCQVAIDPPSERH